MINCRMSETRWKRLNLAANLKTYNTADKSSIKRAICNTTTMYARLRYVREKSPITSDTTQTTHLQTHSEADCEAKIPGGEKGGKVCRCQWDKCLPTYRVVQKKNWTKFNALPFRLRSIQYTLKYSAKITIYSQFIHTPATRQTARTLWPCIGTTSTVLTLLHSNLMQVIHSFVPISTKQCKMVLGKGNCTGRVWMNYGMWESRLSDGTWNCQ